jgi:hypothetical protein
VKALQTLFSPEPRCYRGTELRSHFAYESFGLLGDSAVAFVGECRVGLGEMVDLEDVRNKANIFSPRMVHVLVEHFEIPLREAVLRQRLLVRLAADLLPEGGRKQVQGDDIYVDGRKASVSIATLSPVSALVHFGLNVTTEGAPVPAWGLSEAAIEPEEFSRQLLGRYDAEIDDIHRAAAKVRGVP